MSSGRDVMMESWAQEQPKQVIPAKTTYQRMLDYRDTLQDELDRVNKMIKEYDND